MKTKPQHIYMVTFFYLFFNLFLTYCLSFDVRNEQVLLIFCNKTKIKKYDFTMQLEIFYGCVLVLFLVIYYFFKE